MSERRVIRVFPRRTNASPTDALARFDLPTLWEPPADEVRISVAFDCDREKAERMAGDWRHVGTVTVGGPAYGDPGGEFEPGMYLAHGYTITSRGCPNHCRRCLVPSREGSLRLLTIKDGWILQDNNILACPQAHRAAVYDMLARQSHRPVLSGGIEAARLTGWDIEMMARIKPAIMWFAYDDPGDWPPLYDAHETLTTAGLMRNNSCGCYVLMGWPEDTMAAADERCAAVARLGYFPQAMLLDRGIHTTDPRGWRKFARTWANKIIVGAKCAAIRATPTAGGPR